jgi:hypothetical protein
VPRIACDKLDFYFYLFGGCRTVRSKTVHEKLVGMVAGDSWGAGFGFGPDVGNGSSWFYQRSG